MAVEFVSYDGKYPCACSGKLVLSIEGETVEMPDYCMCPGGFVWFDADWNEHVEMGPWTVEVPEQYAHLQQEIEDCVNANVAWGCCGGCV